MPAPTYSPASRWTAEFLGTLVLVLGGCGTAVLAGEFVGILGGTVGAGILWLIASGKEGFTTADGFATNGFGDHSPEGYSLLAVAVCEIVLTAVFIRVILGASARAATPGFAGLAIGLTLTLIHLISIPVSNTSVNPARSLAVAWFNLDGLAQVWLFIVAPVIGAVLGALLYRGEDDIADAIGDAVDQVDDRI